MQQHGISAPADIGNVPIQHTAFIARRVDGEVSASGAKTAEHPVKFFAKFFFLQGSVKIRDRRYFFDLWKGQSVPSKK